MASTDSKTRMTRWYRSMLRHAKASVAQYPQYDDAYWAPWTLMVEAKRTIKGKGGVHAQKGEALLATRETIDLGDGPEVRTLIWSGNVGTGHAVLVRDGWVEVFYDDINI
jgi:hypothetical protein